MNHLKEKIEETRIAMSDKQGKYLLGFVENMKDGINYYTGLLQRNGSSFADKKASILKELETSKEKLHLLVLEIENLSIKSKAAD